MGKPLEGINDLQKAAAILTSQGKSEWADAMLKHEEIIAEGRRQKAEAWLQKGKPGIN